MLLGKTTMSLHVKHEVPTIDTLYDKEQPKEGGRKRKTKREGETDVKRGKEGRTRKSGREEE